MMEEAERAAEESRLARFLVEQVRDRAAGRLQTGCRENAPRDKYFLGNLRSIEAARLANSAPGYLKELLTKLAPVAFGADFRLRLQTGVGDHADGTMQMLVEVQWACYYRVFPSLEQQRAHQQRAREEESGEEVQNQEQSRGQRDTPPSGQGILGQGDRGADRPSVSGRTEVPSVAQGPASLEDPDGEEDVAALPSEVEAEQREEVESPETAVSRRDRRRERRPNTSDSLAHEWKKISCHATGLIVVRRAADGWVADRSALQRALDEATARAQQVALTDPERVRTRGSSWNRVKVPEADLASEGQYAAFLSSLDTDVVPEWRWEVSAEPRASEAAGPDEPVLSIELTNASPIGPPASAPPTREHPNIEAFLFDAEAAFLMLQGEIRPFTLELAPRGFRHDRSLWGRGFNCAVEADPEVTGRYIATHTPIYRQMRYQTQATPSAPFSDLGDDPLPVLDALLDAMVAYLAIWDRAREEYAGSDPQWEERSGAVFDVERAQFDREIERFRRGRDLIVSNPDVRLAFQLTNRTFQRLGSSSTPAKTAWRLFQIVFFVTQVPGIFALADKTSPDASDREVVDIVYFPTGGGKTEAYLATIVFHAFFDRLRGKSAGVTAWTRFPLRLLTIQQTQRMADVIGIAELLRRSQSDPRLSGRDVAGFAVGYFVGKAGSPNELVDPDKYRYASAENRATWSKAGDPEERQAWRSVITCPSCRTKSVQVELDVARARLLHRCTNEGCDFLNGTLPLYVVDNDIFRYLPTVLVGTIDKLASIGNQRKVSQIFGAVDGKCTEHGYYKTVCPQKGCDGRSLRPGVPAGLSGPTLFVQDELHLLKEGLGTFDAHYETFVQELRKRVGGGGQPEAPLKIIASSATIEAFERQVEHLYARGANLARVFPGPGPYATASFYAYTRDFPQRLFAGLIPHNKTIFNAILELIELYHRVLQELQRLPKGTLNPYGGSIGPGSDEWRALLDYYATSLTYFLANRELDSVRTDVESDVNATLRGDGLEPLNLFLMTGGTGTSEVATTLDRLEQPAPGRLATDAVLATTMVSHGVDIDRLNAMIFYGMPRQNAEYIQASSRVGRSREGVVFTCMHPARERDQSHYGYFAKYHEFLGQMIEPVAINRWAKLSINRTLPGLFMAVLLQLLSNGRGVDRPNRYYEVAFVKGLITGQTPRIRPQDFIPVLEAAYGVAAPANAAEQAFQEIIAQRVQEMLFAQIAGAPADAKWVSEALTPKPMTSLRDVDIAVPIELDRDGERWASRGEGS